MENKFIKCLLLHVICPYKRYTVFNILRQNSSSKFCFDITTLVTVSSTDFHSENNLCFSYYYFFDKFFPFKVTHSLYVSNTILCVHL